jgi:hypothetical protein
MMIAPIGLRLFTLTSEAHKETSMADPTDNPHDEQQERIPAMQSLLENPFLLLFIGVAMPTVFYILWGIMEIVSLPIAP